jgi:hypothetical protein
MNGQLEGARAGMLPAEAAPLIKGANWKAESDQEIADFGWSVSSAGDVNGDGYDEVIVGAFGYDNGQGDAGKTFLYYGSPKGLATSAGWTAEPSQPNANFGYSVSSAGDVNGDGYDDVIVGAPNYNGGQTSEGGAFLYYGSPTGLATSPGWAAESNQASAAFGVSVSSAGDVNSDGYDDVVVGAPYYDKGQTDEGRAFLYYGSPTGLATSAGWTAESDRAWAFFGVSVSSAGDVNGDGYDEVVVGADGYGSADEGWAFLYYGSPTGLATSAGWTAKPDQAVSSFAFSVSSAGDVNGDGYDDVIVGAYRYDSGQTNEGKAFLYYGSPTGLTTSAGWTAESDQASASFGWSVSPAGDVNGDGYDEVIVGAPDYDNGQMDEGRAALFEGSAAGPEGSPSRSAESNQNFASFGYSVSPAGDVNGDGYDDVIVGAYRYDHGQTDEGAAFAWYGSASTFRQ